MIGGRAARVAGALLLATALGLATATAQPAKDAMERIGRELQEVFALLDPAAGDAQRIEALRKALAGFERLLEQVQEEFRKAPERRSDQERIEFHLRYLIRWVRHLLAVGGADPDTPGALDPLEAQAQALRCLEEARRYERERAEDRPGILNRYVAALELARGTPLEREALQEINRLWSEVEVDEPTPPEPLPEPDRPPAQPEEPAAARPDGPLTAEELKELREQLVGAGPAARIAAAERLSHVDQPWVGPLLVERLAVEEDKEVRSQLTAVILRVADRHMVRALGKWSRHKDVERRKEAIGLLGRIGDENAGKALLDFGEETDPEVVRLLIQTAKGLDNGMGVGLLVRIMKTHPKLTYEIIDALSETRHHNGARALIPFLHRRRYPELKDPAIKALRILGTHSIEPLIEALEGQDYRQYAAVALRSVTGERFGISPGAWQQWWRQNRKHLLEGNR
ncbi:MAG: HEAT repeat domain-containing protein [Planctomycetes bacterium]|nr:HEAT repeat domain-containing protein [Planctomycetota bacterium]